MQKSLLHLNSKYQNCLFRASLTVWKDVYQLMTTFLVIQAIPSDSTLQAFGLSSHGESCAPNRAPDHFCASKSTPMLESFNKHFSSPIDGSFPFSPSHWNTLSITCFIFVPLFMWYVGAPSDLYWLKFKRLRLRHMWYRFCNVEPSSFICAFITFFARSAGKLFLALIPQNCLPVPSSI